MRIKNHPLKILLILASIMLSIGIIFSGCSIAGRSEGASFDEESFAGEPELMMVESAEAPAMEMEGDFAAEEMAPVDDGVQYSDTQVTDERKVIKTAYLEVEIEKGKFENVIFKLTALAEQNGGFVSSTQSYSDSDGDLTSGRITIRIPHNQYNSALEKVKNMGTIKSISISGQDVTQEYVDLESRLRNLEAQEEVLLVLMGESKNVEESLWVQRELSLVQGEVEVLKGRMNYLDNMVSFSTIDVFLFEPEPIATSTGWGFLDALKRGLRGAVTVFNGFMVFLIAASPILVAIAIILIIIWQVIRARKRRRAKSGK